MEKISNVGYGITNGQVNCSLIDYSNNLIYVGGIFTIVYDSSNVTGLSANNVAAWDISNNIWISLGTSYYNGVSNNVNNMCLDNSNNLYICGKFRSANYMGSVIGSYNILTNAMIPVEKYSVCLVDQIIYSIVKDYKRNLYYVAGNFYYSRDKFTLSTTSLSKTVSYIATWDISNNSWEPFGNSSYYGTSSSVFSLALDSVNDKLYVGGGFTTVSDAYTSNGVLSAKYVAQWDLSINRWNPLGNSTYNGTNTIVRSLAFDSSNNQLYVGGQFETVQDATNTSGLSANNVAIWDISNNVWRQLGNSAYNGTNSSVRALTLDSSNNQLYVGGEFLSTQDTTNTVALPTYHVARWDITNNIWRQLGSGSTNGTNADVNILTMDVSNNQLYVGGEFTTVQDTTNTVNLSANYVARWDITNNVWRQLGNTTYNGTTNVVRALAIDSSNNQLYVGGDFTSVKDTTNVSGLSVNYVTRWDIANDIWKRLGDASYNGTGAPVYNIIIDNVTSAPYIVGDFVTINEPSLNALECFSAVSWNPYTKTFSTLAGYNYSIFKSSFNTETTCVIVINNYLYVYGQAGSYYDSNGLVSSDYIAKLDLTTKRWYAIPGLDNYGTALCFDSVRSKLYLANPSNINGLASTGIGCLNVLNDTWSVPFKNGTIYALAIDSSCNYLYVGGTFTSLINSSSTTVAANYVAKYDLSTDVITPLGTTDNNGTNHFVNSLVYDSVNNMLYVGGIFITEVKDATNTTALSVNSVARWDIANNVWKQLGNSTYNGINNVTSISSLTFNQYLNKLYIGGTFLSINSLSTSLDNSAKYIAGWDITNNCWRQFGNTTYNGTSAAVSALALDSSNNQVYVGGSFITVKDATNTVGLSAKYVARWDISNNIWKQFGNTTYNGTNGAVNSLSIDPSNNQLYVGGAFTTVQDISNTVSLSANRIARWDISNNVWRQLGNTASNGTNSTVNTISWNPLTSSLYIGGSFTSINISALNSAKYVTIWDISNNVWRQLGNNTYNGTGAAVNALALDSSNNQFYVGGAFITVQDVSNTVALSAKYVARWDISNNVWRQFGSGSTNGTNATTRSLAVDSSNNQIYVGGDFTTVQDITNTTALTVNRIARWDLSNNIWKQLGNATYNGTNGTVNTLTWNYLTTTVYLGGAFTSANIYINTKSSNNYITKWDISNNVYNQVGSVLYNGTSAAVNALALDSSNMQIYVGGAFSTVKDTKNTTGISAKSIAKIII
jgi:hypothetical protein